MDENGKIYVANAGPRESSSVTTYKPDGTPTLPNITSKIRQPADVAVGVDGTIYVANATNQGPDGTLRRVRHDLRTRWNGTAFAIQEWDGVRTHTPGGTKTTPTIGKGPNTPSAIVIH